MLSDSGLAGRVGRAGALQLSITGRFPLMSELEASNIRRRMMEGKLRKAERGALFSSVPTGYVRIDKERIEKDPDERVRSVLELVFRRFDELQSLRQVMLWLLDKGVELPARVHGGTRREVSWTRPTYSRVRDIMENPVYAGAYAFGRSVMRTEVRDGRKHVVQRKIPRPQDWAILIKGTHEGYISWERYERNRQVIADNAQGSGREGARGAVRGGAALLAGLVRCGHCGRKLTVTYSGRWNTFRYACGNGAVNRGDDKCIAFSGRRVDEAVGGALLRALEPVAMEAVLRAVEEDREAKSDAVRQAELALERARYEADRAFRQFDEVDPENRQVAAELERRWNERLVAASEMEAALARAQEADRAFRMGDAERAACLELGADLERAWCHERVSPVIRKRILRAALVEALAHVEDRRVRLVLHWQVSARTLCDGAVVTVLDGRRPRTGTMGAGCRMAVKASLRPRAAHLSHCLRGCVAHGRALRATRSGSRSLPLLRVRPGTPPGTPRVVRLRRRPAASARRAPQWR